MQNFKECLQVWNLLTPLLKENAITDIAMTFAEKYLWDYDMPYECTTHITCSLTWQTFCTNFSSLSHKPIHFYCESPYKDQKNAIVVPSHKPILQLYIGFTIEGAYIDVEEDDWNKVILYLEAHCALFSRRIDIC